MCLLNYLEFNRLIRWERREEGMAVGQALKSVGQRASAEFRRELVRVLTGRMIEAAQAAGAPRRLRCGPSLRRR